MGPSLNNWGAVLVPENIHIPTTEGTENSGGVGGYF